MSEASLIYSFKYSLASWQVVFHFQQLQKYEQGFNRVSASRLWLISQALGTDVNFFFADIPSVLYDGEDVMQQQKTLELVMAYSKIKNEKIADTIFNLLQEVGRWF